MATYKLQLTPPLTAQLGAMGEYNPSPLPSPLLLRFAESSFSTHSSGQKYGRHPEYKHIDWEHRIWSPLHSFKFQLRHFEAVITFKQLDHSWICPLQVIIIPCLYYWKPPHSVWGIMLNKLQIFKVCNLMSSDIHVHLWNQAKACICCLQKFIRALFHHPMTSDKHI